MRLAARILVFGWAVAGACALDTGTSRASGGEPDGLFGTQETRSDNFKPFTKWTSAMERSGNEANGSGQCHGNDRCAYREWRSFLDGLGNKPRIEQVTLVNAYINKLAYVPDPKNWGVQDFWATPGEFLDKMGDCEDYAIAKYLSLRQLGFSDDDLRLVAVQDENLKVGHAILAVYHDGHIYILDNQIKQVAEHTSIHHYRPVFSINRTAWWRHRS